MVCSLQNNSGGHKNASLRNKNVSFILSGSGFDLPRRHHAFPCEALSLSDPAPRGLLEKADDHPFCSQGHWKGITFEQEQESERSILSGQDIGQDVFRRTYPVLNEPIPVRSRCGLVCGIAPRRGAVTESGAGNGMARNRPCTVRRATLRGEVFQADGQLARESRQ